MKDSYYFSHDSNARSDPKILAMRSVYGFMGYGMFWALVEMMREQENYKLSMQGQYVWNALALQLQCEADAVQKFVQCCINDFGLFESDGNYFWSNSLLKRMNKADEKSAKARESAQKRWESERNAKAKRAQSKEKKEKESKDNILAAYTKNSTLLEAIHNFIEMRKKIKKELTNHALSLMLKKLDSLATTDNGKIEILNQSTMNCWQGVFELKGHSPPSKKAGLDILD